MPYLGCQLAVPCFLSDDAQALQKQPEQSHRLWMAGWRAVSLTLLGEPDQQMYAGCCLPPVTTTSSILDCKTGYVAYWGLQLGRPQCEVPKA